MAQVFIELEAPAKGNIPKVSIVDREDEHHFFIDTTGVSSDSDILELVVSNAGPSGHDILSAAVTNGTPVTLDGKLVAPSDLSSAMQSKASPAP